MVMPAVGQNGSNVKRISEVLRRRIRVISMPRKEVFEKVDNIKEKEDALREFVREVVEPVEFTTFEFKDGNVFLSGARESKAILIGRDRSKEKELSEVLQRTFGVKEFKVI